ncbi:MAG TPA: PRC-barrel domain-containing protein [Stellaceae bacterium]|nr:PRC-barrel domain-containing protein [Stellaceae bacterium]
MSKKTMIAAFVVMTAAAMPMASAQIAAVAPDSPLVRAAMTANHLLPGQIRVSDMKGAAVYDTHHQNIGQIKDIVLGEDGRVAAVILQVGGTLGVGGRYVAVGIDDLKIAAANVKPRFTVDMLKDQLTTAQTYNLDDPTETGTSTPPGDR